MQVPRKNVNLNEYTLEDESPSTVSAARINTPAIIILLGSTSAVSALELMRHMLTLKPDDRRRVAFVYIDTDSPPTDLIEFRREHNGIFQEFPLRIAVPAGISHVDRVRQPYNRGLEQRLRSKNKRLPDPSLEPQTFIEGKEPQYFESGAGGIRNNGHVAACFSYQRIYDTLDRALAAVMRVDTVEGVERKKEVQAHIVSFLGGGTGSGIMPDITVMARDLFTHYQYNQRINLFCMLPEPIRGASITDLSWRKSNTVACLLEILAYSVAAGGEHSGRYVKYMRDKVHRLTYNPIANEVFLIGQASMDDAGSTARLVGLDLFQKITDASGVGFLEHSKGVDRFSLGDTDDRGLPTMFGTSCPLEVRFPAEETAKAFAHLSAAGLLPLLASYQPSTARATDANKTDWVRKWKNVARLDANARDPNVVTLPAFRKVDFEEADQSRLDLFWARLERYEKEVEGRINQLIRAQQKIEMKRVQELVQQNTSGEGSLINRRIQHLQRLHEEYTFMLDQHTMSPIPRVPPRQSNLEADLAQPGNFFNRLLNWNRDYAFEVCEAYNQRILLQAAATRYRLLEELLKELKQVVQDALDIAFSWFEGADVNERVQALEIQGLTSMAWKGRLEYPHPHQRHIFDLRTLRTSEGRNLAVEQLYSWATGNDRATLDGSPIDYSSFIDKCVEYLTQGSDKGRRNPDEVGIENASSSQLANRVVDFFTAYYTEKFQDKNLFELLEIAAPYNQRGGQGRSRQSSDYLLEHLQHMRGLIAGLVAFEAELWHKGLSTLGTSIYLGIHMRDGYQQAVLNQALDNLGSITSRGQSPMLQESLDPHRLQVSYGQHAISLSTIRDFYLEQNSAMENYLEHQRKWEGDKGGYFGLMPTHSCSEGQLLVRDTDALPGQKGMNPMALYMRVIRRPFAEVGTAGSASSNEDAYPDDTDPASL